MWQPAQHGYILTKLGSLTVQTGTEAGMENCVFEAAYSLDFRPLSVDAGFSLHLMHSYRFWRLSRSNWVKLWVTLPGSIADSTSSRRLGIDFLRSLLTWVTLWSYMLAVPLLPPQENHPIKNRAGKAFSLQDFLFCCPCLLSLTWLLLASSCFDLFWVHLTEWGGAKSTQGFWRGSVLISQT